MSVPGFVYLARSAACPQHYCFGQRPEAAAMTEQGDPIVHCFPVEDRRGVWCFLFGYFHRKFVTLPWFALTPDEVAAVQTLTGRTVDAVACQLGMPTPEGDVCPF